MPSNKYKLYEEVIKMSVELKGSLAVDHQYRAAQLDNVNEQIKALEKSGKLTLAQQIRLENLYMRQSGLAAARMTGVAPDLASALPFSSSARADLAYQARRQEQTAKSLL